MIQFNRYRLPDETYDFHLAFTNFRDTLAEEINSDCARSIGLLLSLAQKYPLNDRIPACAARLFFWGKVSWSAIEKMMPAELPKTFFYKQEIVGCLGYERSWRKWGITEDQWNLYQGLDPYHRSGYSKKTMVSYRPRNSGFFSVIENIIAAACVAEIEDYEMMIDLSGNWWSYDEPFEDIFGDTFTYTKEGTLPTMSFDAMRKVWTTPDDNTAAMLAGKKAAWYSQIYQDIGAYAPSVDGIDNCGVMFVRGGDKLQTETVPLPNKFIMADLKTMGRLCQQRYILSDDKRIGEHVAALDAFVIDRSHQVEGGYYHRPGQKTSCMNILGNYLSMVEAKLNMSCPSANIVNAAQWTRNDDENWSQANPVYRYLLI